jgi:hypothetical protein
MNIICRQAEDDFNAFLIAQGMENAGAEVFSISHNGMHQRFGAMIPSAKFIVWARYEAPVTPNGIDEMISREMEEKYGVR